MTRTKKIFIAVGALAAVIGVGAVATHSIAGDRGAMGGWKMHQAGFGHGRMGGHHRGARMGMRIEKLFAEVDADKDGQITQSELSKYRADRLAKADANGDGSLQLDEFQGIWADLMRPRMVDHFQFLDEDGDGKITEAEITAPLTMVTRRLDRNDDGVIARDELKRKHRGWHQRWHDKDDDDDDDDKKNDK